MLPKHLYAAFLSLIYCVHCIELPAGGEWPGGQCLDAAEYAGTCKLWRDGYGKAVPAACRGDCQFEQRGPKCYVTGRGCNCNNPCQCTTNGKTNTIGMQCASLDELWCSAAEQIQWKARPPRLQCQYQCRCHRTWYDVYGVEEKMRVCISQLLFDHGDAFVSDSMLLLSIDENRIDLSSEFIFWRYTVYLGTQ